MTLNVRVGAATDHDTVIDYLILAGAGIYEQMFEGSYPGLRLRDVLRIGVCDDSSPYYVENAVLVCDDEAPDDIPCGCLIAFPESDYGLPQIVKTIFSKRRLAPLEALFASRVVGSFYVNTLAVREDMGGRGIARLLLDVASEMALDGGYNSLSLHVWGDNEPAMRLYSKYGFEPVEEVIVPLTKRLKHSAPMILLRAPLTQGAESD